jgi:hypothetical protein
MARERRIAGGKPLQCVIQRLARLDGIAFQRRWLCHKLSPITEPAETNRLNVQRKCSFGLKK